MASSSNAERAADILLVLGESGSGGTSLKDIAAALGQPKPAVLRTLKALGPRGFVVQVARGRYRLGPAVYALAKRDNTALRDAERWRSVLLDLAARYGYAFTLVGRAGTDVVILDMAVGRAPLPSLFNGVGSRVPLGVGSASLSILASMPPAERRQMLELNRPYYLQRSFDPARIEKLVERAVELGYAWECNEYMPGTGGVSVPIHEHGENGAVHNVINLAASVSFLTVENVAEAVSHIRARIAETLGG